MLSEHESGSPNASYRCLDTAADQQPFGILVVEDDEDALDAICRIVHGRYPLSAVRRARDAEEGLELFRQFNIDIVITDIGLPGRSGIELAALIRETAATAEIIAVTAHDETQLLLDAIRLGIGRYLLKPLKAQALFEAMDKAVEKRQLERQIMFLNSSLAARAAELESANRELESFSYSIAHDLRTPLAAIRTLTEVMLHHDLLPGQIKNNLQYIHTESDRLNRLVGALLQFSRHSGKEIQRRSTDLSVMVREVADHLIAGAPERSLRVDIAEGIVTECDPVLVRIVVENLLENAWKYTAGRREARIEFGRAVEGEKPLYFVRDNGTGFDPRDAEAIFDLFRRLPNDCDAEGYGIGLATVRRVLQRHGGTIRAEGKKGEGATFYFSLG